MRWATVVVVSSVGVLVALVGAGSAEAQGEVVYSVETPACIDPERGPNHEECVCLVLKVQDSDYFRARVAQGLGAPERYPSGLRYEGDRNEDPIGRGFERDKEFKAQCALTYYREDVRRAWWFAVLVASGLFTMSVIWGGFVYMQEAAAAEQRATSRGIIFRVMAGLTIVVMAYFLWTMFSAMFVDLGDSTIWTPDLEDHIRRPDW